MQFAVVFFLNSAANFALGIVLSALLGPAAAPSAERIFCAEAEG